MTHASLFTGIGGFDLAARWMGWDNLFQCEWDAWCISKLEKNFPDVQHRYKDIRDFDARPWHGKVDILTGGFPCQPYSVAGQRRGTADERHLWPQMLRIIQEVAPRYVVAENVRGLLNWSGGLVFEQVCADLENAGYQVAPPFVLPAASVNAPHERQRVWIVAHRNSERQQQPQRPEQKKRQRPGHLRETAAHTKSISQREQANQTYTLSNARETRAQSCCSSKSATHTDHQRCRQLHPATQSERQRQHSGSRHDIWHDWPTQPPVRGRNDGIPHRVDRIRGLGNAIVPQIAYRIFLAIQETDNQQPTTINQQPSQP